MAKRKRKTIAVLESVSIPQPPKSKTSRKLVTNPAKKRCNPACTIALDDQYDSTHGSPTLLGVPPEVRNKIYYYALVGDPDDYNDTVFIDRNSHQLPGILRASRQLKEEATKLYTSQNIFYLVIEDMKFGPQRQHWVWTLIGYYDFYMMLAGDISWANLKKWLKSFWKAGATDFPRFWADRKAPAAELTMGQAFDVVVRLSDLPWSRVEPVLDSLFMVADVNGIEW